MHVNYSCVMTTKNIKVVESDLSGEADAATVTFGIAGTWFEIDLTEQEQAEFFAQLKTYQDAARKATTAPGRRRHVPETTPAQREEIRAWAAAQGLEVAQRGRIPKNVIAAWEAEHGPLDSAQG